MVSQVASLFSPRLKSHALVALTYHHEPQFSLTYPQSTIVYHGHTGFSTLGFGGSPDKGQGDCDTGDNVFCCCLGTPAGMLQISQLVMRICRPKRKAPPCPWQRKGDVEETAQNSFWVSCAASPNQFEVKKLVVVVASQAVRAVLLASLLAKAHCFRVCCSCFVLYLRKCKTRKVWPVLPKDISGQDGPAAQHPHTFPAFFTRTLDKEELLFPTTSIASSRTTERI